MSSNLHSKTVEGFGREWNRFDQTGACESELFEEFQRYFNVFPWDALPPDAVGFDMGCGSGRWAKIVAARVGELHCIDASDEALCVATRNLSSIANVEFHNASVDAMPIAEGSMDFGYSLGVLHHIPDTKDGIRACVKALKYGAPFLIYLYYAFDNRPAWFRAVWRVSDAARRVIAALPFVLKRIVTDLIAALVYFPLAKLCRLFEKIGFSVDMVPLSGYRRHSFYTMRTDALDRFGTRLEKRFSRDEICTMMEAAGLENIVVSDQEPYWCACGLKKEH